MLGLGNELIGCGTEDCKTEMIGVVDGITVTSVTRRGRRAGNGLRRL